VLPAPGARSSETERRKALADQLLLRHGVLTREAIHAEGTLGGLPALYDVFKAMEEAGRARRGYFVAGLGAMQFALPGADDRLRSLRAIDETDELTVLAATDPANAYGAALPWPERVGHRPGRKAGALVVLSGGALAAYLGPAERTLLTFTGDDGVRAKVAGALAGLVQDGSRRALLIEHIDGTKAEASPLAPYLSAVGFTLGSRGFLKRSGTTRGGRPPERVRG